MLGVRRNNQAKGSVKVADYFVAFYFDVQARRGMRSDGFLQLSGCPILSFAACHFTALPLV
jgi:hypothetical protein